jgi:hypothetical protein
LRRRFFGPFFRPHFRLEETKVDMTKFLCWTIVLLQIAASAHARLYEVKTFGMMRGDKAMPQPRDLAVSSTPQNEPGTSTRTSKHSWLEADFNNGRQGWGSSAAERLDHDPRMDSGRVKRRFTNIKEEAIKQDNRGLVNRDSDPRAKRRDLQLETAREACMADAEILEAEAEKSYTCTCQADGGTGYRLQCKSNCGEYCNEEVTVCGKKTVTKIYDGAGLDIISGEGFDYTRGNVGRVAISQLGCSEDDAGNRACTECIGVVDGNRACNSCSVQSCADGGSAPSLDCENIEEGATFNFCEGGFDVQEGMFEYLDSNEYDECVDPLVTSMAACETDRQFYETMGADKEYKCTCEENSLGTVVLACRATCGEFCNADETVCGTEVFDQLYDLSGNPYIVANNFFYSKGSNERLVMIQRDCKRPENAGVDGIVCNECSVRVGQFAQCRSCTLQICNDGSQAPLLNCENIEAGAIFNLCEPDSIEVDGGVFDYFSSSEYNECEDNSPPNDVCDDGDNLLAIGGSAIIGSIESAVSDGIAPCELESDGPGLWYHVEGTGKGIVASTCGEETNFDTQISIYSGSCDDLECVASNDDTANEGCNFGHSAVTWFGEEGVVYRIRVHGYGSSRGQFELSLGEADLAIEACNDAKNVYEALSSSISDASCTCEAVDGGSQSLTCMDTCTYCNAEGDICGARSFGGIFDPEQTLHTSFVEHQYTEGRSELIHMEDFDCSDSQGCGGCSATVDGRECNSCDFVDCTGPFGNIVGTGREVECSNIEANAGFNECDDPLNIETGIFEAFSSEEFLQCTQEPLEACQSLASRREESFVGVGTKCSCEKVGQKAIMTCLEENCRYCNAETSVCANITYGGVISGDLGEISDAFQEHRYVEGRGEVLRYVASDDQCVFTIDGNGCSSCELVTCSDPFGDFEGAVVDCENIEEGARFNDCDSPVKIDEGIFEVFSYLEFDQCLEGENSEAVCLEQKEVEERRGEGLGVGTACECSANTITGDHILTCTDSDCVFCNYDASVCANNIFGYNYGRFGQAASSFDGYQYIEGGRDEKVVLEKFDGQCRLTVDDQECSSCEIASCNDGDSVFAFQGIQVSCENIPGGTSFDGCDRVFVDTGLLEVATDFEFHTCIKPRSSKAVCQAELEATEEETVCECIPNNYEGHTLTCEEQGCLYCNAEGDVCGYAIIGKQIGRLGQDIGVFNGFQYIEGRDDILSFGSVLDPSDPRECTVSVGNDECASCNIIECSEGVRGFDVQCENIIEGGSFNECALNPVESGLFEFFSPFEFNECIQILDPMEYCEQQKEFAELSQADAGTVCDCEANDNGAKLACADTLCQFCNRDETVCKLDVAYGGEIGKYGFFISSFDVSEYIVGRNERLVIEQAPPDICRVTVNGQKCESCDKVLCDDLSYGLEIECGNVLPGATYSGCDEATSAVFASLSEDSYGVCLAYDGTFPPTTAPSPSPTTPKPTSETPEDDGGGNGSSDAYGHRSTVLNLYALALLLIAIVA